MQNESMRERLQIEVMDDYIREAEMKHLYREEDCGIAHVEIMREHWEKLLRFIESENARAMMERDTKIIEMINTTTKYVGGAYSSEYVQGFNQAKEEILARLSLIQSNEGEQGE